MGSRLYERSAERAAIDEVADALARGRGGAMVIEARAGLGKTTLMEYAVDAARRHGARVLLARARHLESAAPFEVLRRLLGPAVEDHGGAAALTGAARFAAPLFTPGGEVAPGVDYGCQWLVATLAEERPLVLAVDDGHWADAASLRVLLEVQAEISVLPVLIVVASRPVENPDAQRRLATMAAQPDCVVLAPAPLSREAVGSVVTETLGEPPHDVFVDDCFAVSGGNAFYLHELLRAYGDDFRPDLQAVVTHGSMSLRRTMAWRLGELGLDATRLAQAAAVLGDGCSLSVAAPLGEVDEGVATREAARLEAASILRRGDPAEFVHPLIRAAVEETLTAVEVGELHSRAARLLRAGGAPPAVVVQHLVVAPGAGDAEVAAFLAEQGRAALGTGSVGVAARVLERCLGEPPPAADLPGLQVDLARAEHALGRLEVARTLLAAALESPDRSVRLAAAVELFDLVHDIGDYDQLADLHAAVIELKPFGPTEDEVRLGSRLLADQLMGLEADLAALPAELAKVDAEALPVVRDVDRYHVAIAAIYERTMKHGTTERLVGQLRRAADGLPADPDALTAEDVMCAVLVATFLADDELDESDRILERAAPAAARLGGRVPGLRAELDHRRTVNLMRRGGFEDALARLELSSEYAERHGLSWHAGAARFVRGWIALERGDFATAGGLLRERFAEDHVYPALGALLAGAPEEAVALLEPFGYSSDPAAPAQPIEVELEPHLVASHAFEALGDRDRARGEAERELAIRRRYGPRFRLALALRRQATFLPARQAVGVLEEAVGLARSTPRRPVLVRVLASYGAALRRGGQAEPARAALYEALDGAAEMGMARLHSTVAGEIAAAGGRPRRARRTGPTSLTDAQGQVASLAAAGLSNREIAERLFVTIKTVETHLAAAYRKLGITRRDELPGQLPGAEMTAPLPAEAGPPRP